MFLMIAEKFGRVLIPFECNTEVRDLSKGRICILTAIKNELINQSFDVGWNDMKFKAIVQEDGEWYLSGTDLTSDRETEKDDDVDSMDENLMGYDVDDDLEIWDSSVGRMTLKFQNNRKKHPKKERLLVNKSNTHVDFEGTNVMP